MMGDIEDVVNAQNPVGIPVWPYLFDALSWTGVRPGDDRPEFRAFPVARAEAMLRFIWDVQRITHATAEAAQILADVGEDDARTRLGGTFLEEIRQVEALYQEAIDG